MIRRYSGLIAVAVCAFAAGAVAQSRFPNIDSAAGHLNAALTDLDRAPDRFGGYKANAQRLIRDALVQLEQAKANFR